jgi:N-acetylglucosamine-6-phosphate deacetylase
MNMRRPSVEELRRMVDAAQGAIRKMSIAPELDGALDVIGEMARQDIVPCAAHSTASCEQAMAAVRAGLRCATHVFNGMLPLHHRQPGLLGAVLTCDEIDAELIADGQHVSPVAIDILLRCKGADRVHLVTDNTPWAGLPNGTYRDGERAIVKEGARAYVLGGTLVGSVAPMNLCVRTMVGSAGRSLAKAIQMASLNPARVIGVDDRKGSLEPGKDADLVVIDEEAEVYVTMVRGQVVYSRFSGGMV